jgi:predicted DNA-binding transcriptional regulator
MAKDRAIGAALVAGAVIGVIIYGFLMFYNGSIALIVLKITAFVAVFAILAILGWIGYVMATTPPPMPLEPEPTPASPSSSTTSGQAAAPTEKKS